MCLFILPHFSEAIRMMIFEEFLWTNRREISDEVIDFFLEVSDIKLEREKRAVDKLSIHVKRFSANVSCSFKFRQLLTKLL